VGEPVDPTMEAASAGPARPSGLAVGAQIGGYTLRAVIGEGGMGVVWSAHDPDLDRTLAIKLLRHDRAAPALRRRLLREARAMARLKHPNVLTVYEVGTDGDRDYIAMELVDGGNLDAWLATHPQREDVIAAVIAAGRGLAAAHAAGLVHRDFKPLNVLRSRDGRVLVTDFGLARGLGEEGGGGPVDVPVEAAPLDETMAATPPRRGGEGGASPRNRPDSVLDSPMTEAGALIGTPAYMAPEQYVGEPPEPRTDQFAYCVSVWQALTGARPFQGKTLAELRAAACSGVAEIEADLPPAVRAVLARGLDADPAKRWPDMDALLDELTRVTRPAPRRWWPWLVPAVAAVATIVVVVVLGRGSKQLPVAACVPADKAYAEAWSPALRHDAPERIADSLDRYAKQWTGAYAHACELHAARSIDCLLALRDRAAAFAHGLAAMHGELEPESVLAPPGVCAGAAPPSVPAVPPEALSALGAAYALRVDPSDDSVPSAWKPLGAYVAANAGLGYLRRHEPAKAREALARASDAQVAAHDARLEAEIRLGQYELAVGELEHPEQAKQELQRLHTYARAAVKAAGDDAELDGWLAWTEARRERGREAVALAVQAKRRFDEAGDLRRCALVGAFEAQLQIARGEDAALDEARFAARAADEALERGRLPHEPAVDAVRGALAFANGDVADAHERFDRIAGEPRAAKWPAHKGRVVDGKGARVVAWSGALLGDRERAYTDARRVHGEIVEAAADGTFTIHAPPGAAVTAELGDARAAPQLVGAGPIVIALAPTQAIAGSATGRVPGLEAFAQVTAGPASWLVRAPVGKDGTYKLERVPRGTITVGLIGPAGGGVRRVQGKHWAGGANVVEIVSRTARDGATAWLFREAGTPAPAPRTRGEADGQVMRAVDVTIAALMPVGGDATEAGREHYAPGARHAVLAGLPDGPATVCVASDAAPASRVACKTFAVAKPEGDVQAVLVDGAE
jgi:serine/threonine protein kinase